MLRNALWIPNFVGKTSDQSVIHCWGQKPCRGQLGLPEVKLLRNAPWLPNLVVRTRDQNIMHCWDQRSYRGQTGVARGQIASGLIRCIACMLLKAFIWPKSSSYVIV